MIVSRTSLHARGCSCGRYCSWPRIVTEEGPSIPRMALLCTPHNSRRGSRGRHCSGPGTVLLEGPPLIFYDLGASGSVSIRSETWLSSSKQKRFSRGSVKDLDLNSSSDMSCWRTPEFVRSRESVTLEAWSVGSSWTHLGLGNNSQEASQFPSRPQHAGILAMIGIE